MERAAGIEPATLAWKARALPLCNARKLLLSLGFSSLSLLNTSEIILELTHFHVPNRLQQPLYDPRDIRHFAVEAMAVETASVLTLTNRTDPGLCDDLFHVRIITI